MKTEKRPVEITVAGELPGFEYGECRGVFLNLGQQNLSGTGGGQRKNF